MAWHSSTLLFFDTVCEIKLLCTPSQFKNGEKVVGNLFESIEKEFSPESYNNSSDSLIKLFKIALKIHHDSQGSFDISVGALSKVWGFKNKAYRVPHLFEIEETLKHVGMEKIKIDENSLWLPEGMELDWGGIAKGYAVDLASQELRKRGILNGFINAGGDLFCWGQNPEHKPWKIGIKHPREPGFLGILSISNLGASTTGDYQRYFEVKGKRYHHVFNPFTGFPSSFYQSVTVVGPETTICDALSTALFVSPEQEKIIRLYPEYGVIIVDSKGKLKTLGKKYPFSPLG